MRPMEERFCEEYMIDLNAAGAARRAGYAATTAATAYLWLRPDSHSYKRGVAQRIRALQEERSRRTGISADRVLQEYARIAFADIARTTDGTRILDLAGSDGHAQAASDGHTKALSSLLFTIRMLERCGALLQKPELEEHKFCNNPQPHSYL